MRVTVTSDVQRPGIAPRRLTQIVRETLRAERMPKATSVSVVLVDDPTIRGLNRKFLHANRATDVLSFPLMRERRGAVSKDAHSLLGEVVISVDRARAQARRAGHAVRTEVALLAVHGVLHLIGYDDRSPTAAAAMRRRQRRILRALGEEMAG